MGKRAPEEKEDLVAAMKRLVVAYYHLDNSLFFEYLDDDCVWVLPNHMICRGKQEALGQFASGWVMPSFDAYDMNFELLDSVPGDTAVVMGRVHLLSDAASEHIMAMGQHLTSVWRPRESGWRIVYLHVSVEWSEPASDEVYPVEASRQTWRYAQAVIARNLRTNEKPIMFRRASGELTSVDPSTLLYVQADGKRCVLHLDDDEFEAGRSITEVESKLSDSFIRVHRSYLINRGRVAQFDGTEIKMDDGMVIPVPAKRRAQVRRLLNGE